MNPLPSNLTSTFDSNTRQRVSRRLVDSLAPRLSGERAGERGFPQASTVHQASIVYELKASSPWPSPPFGEERELILASRRVPTLNCKPPRSHKDVGGGGGNCST